jgi:hypothetical protein
MRRPRSSSKPALFLPYLNGLLRALFSGVPAAVLGPNRNVLHFHFGLVVVAHLELEGISLRRDRIQHSDLGPPSPSFSCLRSPSVCPQPVRPLPPQDSHAKSACKSSSGVVIGAMLNLFTSVSSNDGVRKAGNLGPNRMFLMPRWSNASRIVTAFCSYQLTIRDNGRSLTSHSNAFAKALATWIAEWAWLTVRGRDVPNARCRNVVRESNLLSRNTLRRSTRVRLQPGIRDLLPEVEPCPKMDLTGEVSEHTLTCIDRKGGIG